MSRRLERRSSATRDSAIRSRTAIRVRGWSHDRGGRRLDAETWGVKMSTARCEDAAEAADDAMRERYLARLVEVHTLADDVRRLLDHFETQLAGVRAQILGGQQALDVVLDMARRHGHRRRELYDAIRRFERAVRHLRGASIRVLLDGGHTVTEVGRLLGISPQMARRLHRQSDEEP
jgi:hypothetical protein